MKSRGLYETPGGTILLAAHRGIESITLDRGEAHLKDELMPRYAELIYNGFWYSPEREMLQAAIDHTQRFVAGEVSVKLYKGSANVIARTSPNSLYSMDLVTFEEGAVAYDHHDAEGFIRLNGFGSRPTRRGAPCWRRSSARVFTRRCHSREGGNPGVACAIDCRVPWIPAFAGMTTLIYLRAIRTILTG